MIGAPELGALARPLPVLTKGEPTTAIDRFVRSLPAVRPPMSSTAARLTYPGSAACDPLRDWLTAVANEHGALVLDAVMDTLRRPLRGYPIDSPSSARFLLLSSFDGDQVICCVVDVGGTRVDVELLLHSAADVPNLAARLESFVPRVHQAVRYGDFRRPKDRVVLFIADPGRMASVAGPGWRDAARTVTDTWGFDLDFAVDPVRDVPATKRVMALFGGTAVLLVSAAAGAFADPDNCIARWRHRTVVLGLCPLEQMLDEMRLVFELGLVDVPLVTTWDQFSERADELQGDYCELTEECKRGIVDNSYYNANRMWQFASKLSEAARQRYLDGWEIDGRFEDWIMERVGLEVALTDSGLGDTAFEYDGCALSHVKVDDYKDDRHRCGRIYFALDDARKRIVINHIGVHL
jgi:hypothetical protein